MTISRAQMNRQLYQMGGMGIESLSPMQPAMQPAMQSAMYTPLENNYYSGMPMMMAGGGIANLVNREQYGLGSKLKKGLKSFAKTFIPKELDPVLKIAAPFLGPVYGPIASIAGSARTGKIDPFSLAAATLPYLQFDTSATGLSSLMPTGYGGSGALGQFLPGGTQMFGQQGTSLSQMIGDKAREFLSPNTPTQNILKSSDISGAEKFYTDAGNYGFSDPEFADLGTDRTIGQLYSEDFLKNAPEFKPISTTGPTYGELIKKAGSLENVPLSERFNAVKDLSSKALTDLYTKPIINPKTGETTNVLDKNALFATFIGANSYLEARELADKAGIPESEFNEADYQRLKVDPEKAKYKETLKPESFGIRPQSADGGRIGYGLGDLVRSSGVAVAIPGGNVSESRGLGGMIQRLIQQNPQMFKAQMSASRRDFIDNDNNGIDDREEAAGGGLMNDTGGVLSIKLTPAQAMAMGGRIGYQMGGLGMESFALTQRPDDLGLPGFDDDNPLQNREPTLEEAIARGVIFYDPIAGFQVNPLTGGRMGTGMDPNFIARKAMQAEQDAAARTSPVNVISRGVSSSYLSPNQSMQQDLLMRQGAVQTGGTSRSASEGSSGINPLFRINRLIQAEQDAAARVTPKKAKGGIMGSEIPVRQNPGGITELDLRAKGGYIPVGIKEKADDVPAMLSKNEFVFTADAVRGAGGGNINKGAQKMYKLMKSLEKKVKKMKKVA